jgi:hypothetical protein
MNYEEFREFCDGATHISENAQYHDFCGNHDYDVEVIKNGRRYKFNRSWGPSFNDLNDGHEFRYITINPVTFATEYHNYIIDEGNAQYEFNF